MAAVIRLLRPTEFVLKKRHFLLILLLFVAAVVFWAYRKKNEPPKVSFAKVKREPLVSTLITNGKVEPLTHAAVRVDTAGLVVNLPVKEGQRVANGALLAELNAPGLQAQLTAALARVEQAKADLDNIERGGRKSDLAEIESGMERAKLDHQAPVRRDNRPRGLDEKARGRRFAREHHLGRRAGPALERDRRADADRHSTVGNAAGGRSALHHRESRA